MNKIQDDSFVYQILRTSVGFVYPNFFRQIEIRGRENIPSGEPVIFAPNHQSALMDALGVLFYQPGPIVFMARADIFRSGLNRRFLRILKITPIFRIRDGFENLSKNEVQMNGAVDVLLDRKQLCLMPEGNQGDQHKLRPLVKGLFRIAYTAEEQFHGTAHVKIIPVGIDYSYYQHAGADLVISYGKPIEIKDYVQLYEESPANALNVLRERLADSMSNLMQNIRSTDRYDMVYRLSCYGTAAFMEHQAENGIEMTAKTMAGLRFDARFALGKLLDKIDAENPGQILELYALCRRLKALPGYPSEVAEWMDDRHSGIYTVLLMILSIPLIPGFLINFPAWYISQTICKNVEDTQMHSTFAFTVGILFNAMVYILVTFYIAHIAGASALQTLIVFVSVTVFGTVSERARQALRLPLRNFIHLFGNKKEMLKGCKSDYRRLKEVIKRMLKDRD